MQKKLMNIIMFGFIFLVSFSSVQCCRHTTYVVKQQRIGCSMCGKTMKRINPDSRIRVDENGNIQTINRHEEIENSFCPEYFKKCLAKILERRYGK